VKTPPIAALLIATSLAACGGESETNGAPPAAVSCQAASLPLEGSAEAPSLSELFLDCTADAVEALALVTDSSGSADLDDVTQRLRVHRSEACDAGVLEIADDVAASGKVEAFGIVFEKSELPTLYAMICSSERWPVDVELRDNSGNVASGRVGAAVMGDAP
jgi:hypothetical protein